MFRAGVQGENDFNYTSRVKGPPTQVPAEDEGSPALWCHCCPPPVYQNSHQEHKLDQWTHTDLKYSEERRQQTLKWGRRLIDGEYQRLRVRIHWVFGSLAPRGVQQCFHLKWKQVRRHFPTASRQSPNPSQQPVIWPIFIWSI